MKILILMIAFASTFASYAQVNDSLFFKNEREMLEYAFQNTDLSTETNGLFLDYWEHPDSVWMTLQAISSSTELASNHIFQVGNILARADLNGNFNREELFHPVFDHIQSLDHVRTMRIPIVMYDTEISKLKPSGRATVENWTSIEPFPILPASQFGTEDFFFGSVMFDSIPYENVVLYFDEATVRSNRSRNLEKIRITRNGINTYLSIGDEFPLDNWSSGETITFTYLFDDNSEEIVTQKVQKTPSNAQPKSGFWGFLDDRESIQYDPTGSVVNIDKPELQYAVKYGCQEGVLLKPYIVVAGWGTHTNISTVNDVLGWPSDLLDWSIQTNEAGYIENLHDQGYDVIMAKFYPPNASILKNAELLEELIIQVNVEKFANDSYEENVVNGYSAGALAVKHTLLAMEKKYLAGQGPHHHTKLFISYEGENQGANIPLGLQHHVKYLYDYEHSNNIVWFNSAGFSPGAAMYALNYILTAPLSRELLAYYYTGTGDSNNPGQGHDAMRVEYLNDQFSNNHEWNTHILGYPAFCRNISISNGSSTPNIDFNTFESDHFPFPSETGATYFKAFKLNKRWEAKFVTHGYTRVFSFEKKPWFSSNWGIEYEASTLNMPVLDNASGGTIFLKNNPLDAVIDVSAFEMQLGSEVYFDKFVYAQYSFTPTVYTHDIKNYDPFANGGLGYMNYNFKDEKLNFDNEFDAALSISSNTIGYPHLGYPSNHYNVTSFDALFTWDQNTEHVTASVAGVDSEGRFYPEWTDTKNAMKNFMVEEAEPAFIFLQNDHIGEEGNGSLIYRVNHNADEEIYFGKRVTQKTDFKEITLENHARVESMAGHAIYVKDGFHAKPGTEWHAFIGDEFCTKSYAGGGSQSDSNFEGGQYENRSEKAVQVFLVPNPAHTHFSVQIKNELENEAFSYYLTELSGQQVGQGASAEGEEILLSLRSGIYLLTLKTATTWYTEKLIIQ